MFGEDGAVDVSLPKVKRYLNHVAVDLCSVFLSQSLSSCFTEKGH